MKVRVKITREQIAKAIGANPSEMYFMPEGETYTGPKDFSELIHGWGNTPEITLDLPEEQLDCEDLASWAAFNLRAKDKAEYELLVAQLKVEILRNSVLQAELSKRRKIASDAG